MDGSRPNRGIEFQYAYAFDISPSITLSPPPPATGFFGELRIINYNNQAYQYGSGASSYGRYLQYYWTVNDEPLDVAKVVPAAQIIDGEISYRTFGMIPGALVIPPETTKSTFISEQNRLYTNQQLLVLHISVQEQSQVYHTDITGGTIQSGSTDDTIIVLVDDDPNIINNGVITIELTVDRIYGGNDNYLSWPIIEVVNSTNITTPYVGVEILVNISKVWGPSRISVSRSEYSSFNLDEYNYLGEEELNSRFQCYDELTSTLLTLPCILQPLLPPSYLNQPEPRNITIKYVSSTPETLYFIVHDMDNNRAFVPQINEYQRAFAFDVSPSITLTPPIL